MLLQYHEYVLAIAKYGSMSRAAQALYISQPTLSRAIRRLEEELDVAIFDRSHNHLVLTEAGEKYLLYANEMFLVKKKLIQELEKSNPSRQEKLTIGFPFTYSRDFLAYILPEFYKKHPNIKLEIREMSGGLLEENLLNHTLDLAIIADTSFSPKIHCEYLETQRILLVVPKSHPLYYVMDKDNYAILDTSGIQKLNNQPFIGYSPNEGMYHVCEKFFQMNNICPKIILEVQDTSTAYGLAVSGAGLTMISELRYLLKPLTVSDTPFCCYQLGSTPYTRTRVIAYPHDTPLTWAEESFIAIAKNKIHNLHPMTILKTTCNE